MDTEDCTLSDRVLDHSGQQEVDQYGQQEVDHSGEQEVGHSGEQEVGYSGEQEVEHSGQQEVDQYEQQEVDHSGQQEVDQYEQQAVEHYRQQEVDQYGQQEVDHDGQQEVDHYGQQELDHYGQQEMDHYGQQEVNTYDFPDVHNFQEEEAALPPDYDWLKELYEEDSDESDADLVDAADFAKQRSCAETARMFKLRRTLDQLDCFHQQKEHAVLKAREELKLCHQNIKYLLEQREDLEVEIEKQKAADDAAMVFRFRSQHNRVCRQLQNEEELEGRISTELKLRELELSELQVELGRFSSLREEVEEEEQHFQAHKAHKAMARLQQERKVSQNLQLQIQQRKEKEASILKKEEAEYQKKIEEARANRKIAAKYLKQTIKRIHQEEAEKQQQNRELVEKRTQALKSLKSNIAATQERFRVQQSRAKAKAQKKEQQDRQLRESLQAQGFDTVSYMHQKKHLEEIKRKQEEFEESHKSKKAEIVAKILLEEQMMKRRKTKKAQMPKPSASNSLPALRVVREKLLHYLDSVTPAASEEKVTIRFREMSDISSSSSTSSDIDDLEEAALLDVDVQSLADSLAEPEFSGLWDQDIKKVLDDETVIQENAQEKLAVTSTDINRVPGREPQRPSFYCKPDVIIFKDFDVGKTYKKKFVLTNTSYTINQCRPLGVSPELKDFLTVKFEPPGSLSSGMSCDVQAIFQPKINKDLEGEIKFATVTGSFSVPVRCITKKCNLVVDIQFVDFGSHIVGQTISRTITLTNKGALATTFHMDTSSFLSPESSRVQMPATTCQETCIQMESTESNQDKSASLITGETQPEQESQLLSESLQQKQPAAPEVIPEITKSSLLDTQTYQTASDCSDIRLGDIREGEIGPFESIKLEILFTPTLPGETTLDFHIKFSDETSEPIPIQARGVTISVPVWVEQPNVDLKICMFDRLYQDTIVVQSGASTALKVAFEVCPEMKKHMEILPKTGVLQAQSAFKAQLKFMPRRSLSLDAGEFFDSNTGVLEVPIAVQVTGQVEPTCFTVHGVVTSSDLQFDRAEVDFGFCSISESVKSSVRLTSLSLLPQEFGFVGVPEFIEVQPNEGFGTLLPQETLEIDLIFSARFAKEYHFQLSCKSGINREFLLPCRAVGVRPLLEFSHTLVQFAETALGDHSTAVLHLINPHANPDQLKSVSGLAGKHSRAPAGPRLFSFAVPENSDLSITPAAGRLLPRERYPVQVTFRPRLPMQEIKNEARRLLHRAKLLQEKELERNRLAEQEVKKETSVESSKGKKVPGTGKSKKTSSSKAGSVTESPEPAEIQPGSQFYEAAKESLLYSFNKRCREHTVPCYVSDGDPPEDDRQAQPTWSPINTIYLKIHCPAVRPPLVVFPNNDNNLIDFQKVTVGDKVIKRVTIKNISLESLDLRLSILDVCGPFSLLNALRSIPPGETHTLILAFSPSLNKKYADELEVHCQMMTVTLRLRGEGVLLAVTSSHTGGLLDFGYVLEKETSSAVVKLQNNSVLAVSFQVLLQSLSASRPPGGAEQVSLLLDRHLAVIPTAGTQNYNGLSVFSVVPAEGSIPPEGSQDITVSFQPDHPSVNYHDKLTIKVMNMTELCVMNLKGAASSHNMYLQGGDQLTVPVDPLLPSQITSPHLYTESGVMESTGIPLLVNLRASYRSGQLTPGVRELQVGCISSPQAGKKTGEFYWDDITSLQQQGFSIEPVKGSMESGQSCAITIRWSPYSGYKPHEVVQACVPLTLQGDETTVYRVTLLALVSVTAD